MRGSENYIGLLVISLAACKEPGLDLDPELFLHIISVSEHYTESVSCISLNLYTLIR